MSEIFGYEYWVKCPKCEYQTDASRGRHYDNDGHLVCGADSNDYEDKGCGARLRLSVEVADDD